MRKITLYHYTSAPLAESILGKGLLPTGHIRCSDGSIDRGMSWLTDDPSEIGHGLPIGGEVLKESQIAYAEAAQGRKLKNIITVDKTAIRLAIEIEANDPYLINFVDWSERNEGNHFAKVMGLSCYHDLNSLNDEKLKKLIKKSSTKEKTWWLYFKEISPQLITDVKFKAQSGFVSYDFEKHGRVQMSKSGFFMVNQAANHELVGLLPKAHINDNPKAFMISNGKSEEPHVFFRGGGFEFSLTLENKSVFSNGRDKAPSDLSSFSKWIDKHIEQLNVGWKDAVQKYYEFHPLEKS